MVGNPSPSQLASPRRVVPCTQHGVRGGAELRWALSCKEVQKYSIYFSHTLYLESLPAGDPFPGKLLRNPAPETTTKMLQNHLEMLQNRPDFTHNFRETALKCSETAETAQNGSKLIF